MSTGTLLREVDMDTRQEARGHVGYPPEFEVWVEHKHRTWANALRNAARTYKGMALHAEGREMWQGIQQPFTKEFEAFLDRAVRELRIEQAGGGWQQVDSRYQRVEDAITRLQERDSALARVVLFYQEPFRDDSVVALAASLGVSDGEPRRMFRRALGRLWFLVGCVW